MKLIQIDNTLYIVEGDNKYKVSEDSKRELTKIAYAEWINGSGVLTFDEFFKRNSIDITDIKHRIKIKSICDDPNCDDSCGLFEAFLLPEKEEPNVLIPDPNSPRNWTEDYRLENGNYTCFCRICNNTFIGYKRRVMCKVCSNKEDTGHTGFLDVTIGEPKLYSIEQIKSAINQSVLEGYQIEILEREIINNLQNL